MSTHEFQNYLVLLGKFLHLSAAQQQEISGELEDHFQERLAELEGAGVGHDRAVRLAVEEFGDAAALASRFLSLSRNNRRRWIMRCTAFSLAGALTALVLVSAFWPQDNTGPGPLRAAAQNQPGGAGSAADASGGSSAGEPGLVRAATIEENNSATEAKLTERLPAEFNDAPLSEVLSFIGDRHGIEIYVDKKALEEEGTSTDMPVSLMLKQVRGDMLLDLVLKQAGGLTYVVRDGIIVVSTATALEQATEVRVYNCRDLLALPQFGGGGIYGVPGAYPGLPAGVPSAPGAAPGGFGPRSSGPGELPGSPGAPGGFPPGFGAPPDPGSGLPGSGASPPLPGASPFGAPGSVPPDAGTGSPDAGNAPAPGAPSPEGAPTGGGENPFNPSRPLPQVFDLQGGGSGAGGFIGGGAAGATGGGGLGGPTAGVGMMGLGGGMGPQALQTPAEKLIAIIEGSVFTQTWENVGGVGTIREYGGLVVINNNVRVHREVENLLGMLREAASRQPGTTVGGQ